MAAGAPGDQQVMRRELKARQCHFLLQTTVYRLVGSGGVTTRQPTGAGMSEAGPPLWQEEGQA